MSFVTDNRWKGGALRFLNSESFSDQKSEWLINDPWLLHHVPIPHLNHGQGVYRRMPLAQNRASEKTLDSGQSSMTHTVTCDTSSHVGHIQSEGQGD